MGMVTAGGGGKHKYNVTYAEKQNFHLVSLSLSG